MNTFFTTWLSDNPFFAITITVIFSLLTLTMILIYLVAFFQGRKISFWLPQIGEKPTKNQNILLPTETQPVLQKSTISIAGLQEIVFKTEDVVWEDLFNHVNELDLFFAYASLWRTTNEVRLLRLSQKKGARIRLILPDISNSIVVNDLARRFNKTPERIKAKVEEAKEQFDDLAHRANTSNGAKIEVYLYSLSHHYSLYRFDNTYIFAIYQQRLDKAYVPLFICKKGGELANFFDEDIRSIVSEKTSRQII